MQNWLTVTVPPYLVHSNVEGREMNWLIRRIIIGKINNLRKQIEGGENIMKTGIFTSEFYVTLATAILSVVAKAFNLSPDIQDALLKLAIAYISSRTVVKIGGVITNGKK